MTRITVKRVEQVSLNDDEIDGHEVIRVVFEEGGPVVQVSKKSAELLRGPQGLVMRQILMDSINAVLDSIMVN